MTKTRKFIDCQPTGSSSKSLSCSSSTTSSTLCPWSRWTTGGTSCCDYLTSQDEIMKSTWSATTRGDSLSGSISLSPSVLHSYCNSSPTSPSTSSPARIGIPSLEWGTRLGFPCGSRKISTLPWSRCSGWRSGCSYLCCCWGLEIVCDKFNFVNFVKESKLWCMPSVCVQKMKCTGKWSLN